MIVSFIDKGLSELFTEGKTGKIDKKLHARIVRRLDVLDQAKDVADLKVPGFDFHALKGYAPTMYTIHVNGPWCITFEFSDGHAHRVDLEQYH
ncbi:type II toxin-antitoxin system RelE/ParE family toxin [Salinarimonas sp. NSM]|uniref:type II toxin-antitoxin system RelE/ParE family toxin n=1 Tax=Salinarimonas sp. NSM TaxID=3458003 RepID=UPI0040363085